MKARFTPEAEVELHAEARYYEQQVAGLGKRFTHEIEAALALACSFPERERMSPDASLQRL